MDAAQQTADELGERIFGSLLGMVEILSIHLGDRLGWYRSLRDDGPANAADLAERTDTHPRYAREWLEQQAVIGLLIVESGEGPDDRVFSIPPSTAEVLTDETSLAFMAPFARMWAAVGPVLPRLLEVYRSGSGVSWEQMGTDMRESQSDANRPWFERELAGALAGVPSLHDALSRPGARMLDVGCGGGWSTIALARAYPEATVLGLDIDEPSIDLATRNAHEAGLSERATFVCQDASTLAPGSFDAVFAFECVHDMPRPVEVLAAARTALAPGGAMVVMDEGVAEEFAPDGDEVERIMYGYSLFICLPDGLSSAPSVGTGTVMRPSTLRAYADEAGFTGFEILPIEGFAAFRFYRLTTSS